MEPSLRETTDLDIRHFIYMTFAATARPPTTLETADHFVVPAVRFWENIGYA